MVGLVPSLPLSSFIGSTMFFLFCGGMCGDFRIMKSTNADNFLFYTYFSYLTSLTIASNITLTRNGKSEHPYSF